MRRRKFIKLIGGSAAAWPLRASAQQGTRCVGVLLPLAKDDPEAKDRVGAFEQGLQQAGWTNGKNLEISG
jgi:putative ABC transport system substrate-binding protein